MKKILALIMALVACFSMMFTACAPDNNDPSGEQGGQESVIPGQGTGGDESQEPESGSNEDQEPENGDNDDVIPPITDGGAFDGGDY